jgi:hypothetical protein
MSQNPPPLSPTVFKQFAGLWIAWDRQQTQIIASGRHLAETRAPAKSVGESDEFWPNRHVLMSGSSAARDEISLSAVRFVAVRNNSGRRMVPAGNPVHPWSFPYPMGPRPAEIAI